MTSAFKQVDGGNGVAPDGRLVAMYRAIESVMTNELLVMSNRGVTRRVAAVY